MLPLTKKCALLGNTCFLTRCQGLFHYQDFSVKQTTIAMRLARVLTLKMGISEGPSASLRGSSSSPTCIWNSKYATAYTVMLAITVNAYLHPHAHTITQINVCYVDDIAVCAVGVKYTCTQWAPLWHARMWQALGSGTGGRFALQPSRTGR